MYNYGSDVMKNIIENIKDENVIYYLEYLKYERRLSDNTIDSYGENLLMLLEQTRKDALSLSSDDIRNFLLNIEATSKTKAHYLSFFNSFYNYMIFNKNINNNPCDSIKAPKLEKKLPNYLTDEEVDKLLDIRLIKPADYRNKAMLEVLYATGIRISELTNLELNQIDFDECIIRVLGKGKKTRIVPLGDTAIKYLTLYINEYRKFLLKTKTSNYVFINKDGNKISRKKASCPKVSYTSKLYGYTYNNDNLELYIKMGYIDNGKVYDLSNKEIGKYDKKTINKTLDDGTLQIYSYQIDNNKYYFKKIIEG